MSLFVGITSWNSSPFLKVCLDSLRKTCGDVEVCVLDNCSTDDSHEIARQFGAKVVRMACTQPEALNALAGRSRAGFTLLVHADVVFLGAGWCGQCIEAVGRGASLVSPEDTGCGNGTRPWGKGMPESSFLFFDTRMLRRLRETRWIRRFRLPWPQRGIDFFGEHITYNLPTALARRGGKLKLMDVHTSPPSDTPIVNTVQEYRYWQPLWAGLRYGLGNFYSLDGILTHYHNWYDRQKSAAGGGPDTLPADFLSAYSRNFLSDYAAGMIVFPEGLSPETRAAPEVP